MDEYDNNFNGCLIGFVVGDALGSPLEFSDRDILNQMTEMETNYLYNLPAGYWTEKTSELLCMATTIAEQKSLNPEVFLLKFHQFITSGYMSPNDKPFEINTYIKITGLKIGKCLKYRKKLPLIINPNDHHQTDCQPIFRIAPIVLKYHNQPHICMQQIDIAVNLTHISRTCVDICKFYANLMIGALMGVRKESLLSEQFNIMDVTTYGDLRYNKFSLQFLENCSDTVMKIDHQQVKCQSNRENLFLRDLFPSVVKIQRGCYKNKTRDQIVSDNNILNCVEAALWAFYSTNNFEDGCVLAVNLGLNANAIGSIYGQLAGLYYGLSNIPQKWLNKLYKLDYLQELNTQLR